MRNLETWTAAVALALTTIATLLVSPAIGLIALAISAVSFGLALARASDHAQDRASARVPQHPGMGVRRLRVLGMALAPTADSHLKGGRPPRPRSWASRALSCGSRASRRARSAKLLVAPTS
jgi:hypothetical protein